ncbi:MAG: GDP-L-fucose synthase, partial [Methylococcaceae bacterium]|nr:GDP-L-fucose synthase [Methylococcaceae bacterium]
PLVNIGTGIDVTIKELAELVRSVVGYNGALEFDSTKPDGTMRKLMDVSFMQSLGWKASTTLGDGLVLAYKNYLTY